MGDSLAIFGILLDNADDTYSPGEKVTGEILVQLRRAKCLKGLKIKFKGEAEVEWIASKDDDGNVTWDRRNEDYFRSEFYLLGGAGNTNILEISEGRHKFPFKVSLPRNVPSSFEHTMGNVRYTIKAIWERPWSSDYITSRTVTVETPYDLTEIPAAMRCINDEENKSFCCFPFCIPMGSMAYSISIPSSGFAVGETLRATVSMDNGSSRVNVTAVRLKLKQHVTFYGSEGTRNDTIIVQQVNHNGPFDKREDDLVVPMKITRLPPTSFPHCSLINVKYNLVVSVGVSGCHCDPEHQYPLYIGTKPPVHVQPVRPADVIPVIAQTHTYPPTQAPSAPFYEDEDTTPCIVPHPAPSRFPHQISGEASTSTSEDPPPSYDQCMGTSRESLLPQKKH